MARRWFGLALVLLLSCVTSAQNSPQSDPQAVAFASQAMAALTNGVAISDMTLTGNTTWIAGSDNETGSATLQSKGTGESRVDLNLSGGTRTEIRNDSSSSAQGETIAPDGTLQAWAPHNCYTNASWFFPALSILAETSDSSLIFAYVGQEVRGATSVQHLRVYRYSPSKRLAFTTYVQKLSAEDIFLDSTSLLPVAFVFNTHPEDDPETNIIVEIDFNNFQPANGLQVPMHVQKLIDGGLAVDLSVTGVVLNSGLTDSPFASQ